MTRVNLDTASASVQQFVQSLPIGPQGVELTLHGEVLCKVVRPGQLTDEEKDAVLLRGRNLVQAARLRNRDVPASVIEREIRGAVDEDQQFPGPHAL